MDPKVAAVEKGEKDILAFRIPLFKVTGHGFHSFYLTSRE
jgi:hypothetical protein